MLQSVAGHDPTDPASIYAPPQDYIAALNRPLRGLRIGVLRDWYELEVKAVESVIEAMNRAIEVFASLGCTLKNVSLPPMRDFTDCKTPISLSEIYAIHEKDLKTRPRDFGHSLRWRIMPGALIRAEDYIQAMRWRTELTQQTLSVFDEVDLLVTAGSFAPAPTLAPDEPPTFIGAAVPSITTPFNLTGMPALSVCNGFDAEGLPLGHANRGSAARRCQRSGTWTCFRADNRFPSTAARDQQIVGASYGECRPIEQAAMRCATDLLGETVERLRKGTR